MKNVNKVTETSSKDASHCNINLGSNIDKMNHMNISSHNVILHDHNLMLEHTIFGYAVSGKVPEALRHSTYNLQVGYIVPVLAQHSTATPDMFIGYQEMVIPDYGGLEHVVRCLWEKEQSLGVMKNETHTDDDEARRIFKEVVRTFYSYN